MIRKLYLSVFISMFLVTVAQASGTHLPYDPYGNLGALLGGESLAAYTGSTPASEPVYGGAVYDPYGNLGALLGTNKSHSSIPVSPEY